MQTKQLEERRENQFSYPGVVAMAAEEREAEEVEMDDDSADVDMEELEGLGADEDEDDDSNDNEDGEEEAAEGEAAEGEAGEDEDEEDLLAEVADAMAAVEEGEDAGAGEEDEDDDGEDDDEDDEEQDLLEMAAAEALPEVDEEADEAGDEAEEGGAAGAAEDEEMGDADASCGAEAASASAQAKEAAAALGNDGGAAASSSTSAPSAPGAPAKAGDEAGVKPGAAAARGRGRRKAVATSAGAEGGEGEKVAKRRGKPVDPNAPKRPLAPFYQYSTVQRPLLVEQRPELKSDLAGIGKALSESWAKVSDEEKAVMQKKYDEEKAVYDVEMAKYKQTEGYKEFAKELRVWTDARDLKKLDKKHKASGTCPLRPKSAYMRFAGDVRERIQKENPGMSLGDLGKEVAVQWAALSVETKKNYEERSKQEKEQYDKDLAVYKRSDSFRAFVDQRAALELKQGLRGIKEGFGGNLPRKPPTAAMLWAAAAGQKGGFSQIANAFRAISEEERQKYENEVASLRTKFQEETAAFMASAEGRAYAKHQALLKRKLGVRAARQKFLVDAPKRPPNAATFFAAAKQDELAVSSGLSGAALSKRCAELWEALPQSERKPFEEQAARALEEFHAKMEEFKNSDKYAEMQAAEASASRGAAKIQGGRAKPKAKAKAKAKAAIARPEGMPRRPLDAFSIFRERQASSAGARGQQLRAAFEALPEDEKASLLAEEKTRRSAYDEAMLAFSKTNEGKQYARQVASLANKQKILRAKQRYLADEPKKPPSAVALFAASLKNSSGSGRPGTRWAELSSDEKQKWENERNKLMEEYEVNLKEFHASSNFRKFEKATGKNPREKSKAQGKSKAKPRPDAIKAGAPKKPPSGFNLFIKKSSTPMTIAAAAKAWGELGGEGQKPYEAEAKSLRDAYEKEYNAWKKSKQGKAFERETEALKKKQKEQKAKERYLSGAGAPQPPPSAKSAYFLFVEAARPELAKTTPGLTVPQQAKKLSAMWNEADEQRKKVFEEKAKESKAAYEVALAKYHQTPEYKKYLRAAGKGKKEKKRMSAKEKASAAASAKEKEEIDEAMEAIYGGRKRRKLQEPPAAATAPGRGRGRGRSGVAASATAGGARGGRASGRGGRGAADVQAKSDSDVMGSDSETSSSSSSGGSD
eukprot:TRINITY_DN13842_c0_g1_i1.p1 TRINITY_DN13842_c0_g1~~TRINITY_DN13842_c0_g1_i1.p1  ORF type:complete len:1154 (-),score=362.75 TRINITY_DN13842_c0_g1_i1:37-3498(-)